MNDYFIEEHNSYRGYEYMIVLQSIGHRCAYINVINTQLQYIDYMSLDCINVHGGLTFSSVIAYGTQDGWWIGWDYAHYGDRNDYESVLAEICETNEDYTTVKKMLSNDYTFELHGIIYTHSMVQKEVYEAIDAMIEKGQLDVR